MITKKPKHGLLFILAAAMLTAFVAISCNNSDSDKKESPENKVDTSKMDTASTRPVKTPD